MNTTIFVGLDVHKATVSVPVAEGLRGGEVRCLGTFPNRSDQIAKLAQRLAREGRRLSFCYDWLATVRFDHPAQQIVLQDYIHAVTGAEARVERLTRQIEELIPQLPMAPVVEALQAMGGVGLIVAVIMAAEVGDFSRFAYRRQLMAYLGLAASEHSSGVTVRRGGLTKAGNALARRVLIEGAWTYRMQARVSRKLHDRNEKLPQAIATSPGRPRSGFAPLSPARGGRQGEGRRCHRDRPQNGGLSVGDRLSGPTPPSSLTAARRS